MLTILALVLLTTTHSLSFSLENPTDRRILVLLDDFAIKSSHSLFFGSLQSRGYNLEFKLADDPKIALQRYGQFLYDGLIVFAPTIDRFGGSINQAAVLEFVDSGRDLILALDANASDLIREIAVECGVDFDDAPVLFQGIGHSLNPSNNLVLKVLSASPAAYSANPTSKLSNAPMLTGSSISLVSVVQARNNARILISGSLKMFSDRFFRSGVQKAGSSTRYDKSGNEQFVTELSQWIFHERGHLKEYSVEIYEWSGTSWEPYVADDVQVQFYMMSPYVLKTLSTDKKGLYYTSFKVPDVYGVFQFKVEYQRLGYTSLSLSKQKPAESSAAMNNLQYIRELTSYEAACKADADLQSFDTTLQARTSHVINALAVGVEVRSLSFDSLKEVTGCLLDMNQEVVKVILDCKKDIWKSQELFELVEDYFENSLQTLDFCTALEKCLKKVKDTQLLVMVALQQFDDEQVSGEKTKYAKTLEELRNFKEAGDPFTQEFFQMFQSVYKQQMSMLEKLQIRKNKLDKKLRCIKAWRKVSNVIFVATFAAVLICSVVAAAMAAPPVAAALAAASALPIGSVGRWIDSLWKNYENAMKGQKELINTMQVGTYVAIKDLDNIRVLIDRLEIEIETLLKNVDFAIKEDEVKVGIEEIKKKMGVFAKNVEELGVQADMCSRDIRRARTVILQRIIKHPNH
ncbi:hypothetical protein Cgig2_032497 [Carnegiea gigantea]|uniref:Dolichyl-diphosphooligosaccharide--protein glycosyltransferase 48 kDa subunit n=1 Tax=Carnegiea gigantea TaxID=171969 RepID=A0A9Q1KYI2_9CARY|nr:hypothetical protein Cgig2_032497 [Carnegiea gigantea]